MHIKSLALLLVAVAVSASAFCFSACFATGETQVPDDPGIIVPGGDQTDDSDGEGTQEQPSEDDDVSDDEDPSDGDEPSGGDNEDQGGNSPDQHVHDLSYVASTAATCTEDGNAAYWICSGCGKYFADEDAATELSPSEVKIPSQGHDYFYTVVEPTCSEQGYTVGECSVCGDIGEITYTPQLPHDFGEWETVTPASCENEGEQVRHCKTCGFVENQAIPPEHDYKPFVIESTCVSQGYVEYVCMSCGYSYIAENSYMPEKGHSYGEWIYIAVPSCVDSGERVRYCSVCETVESQTLPATGHSYSGEVHLPSCTEDGYTEYICSNCGDSYKDDIVGSLGHEYGEWVYIAVPSCQSSGERVRYCSVCENVESEVLPATDHLYCENVYEPACTEQGYTEYVCSCCGDSYRDGYVDSLGHDYGEWKTVTEATCSQYGEEISYCTRCDEYQSREIPKTDHEYAATEHEPACTEQGYTEYVCSCCGDSYRDGYVDSLGHDYGEWKTVTEATCSQYGEEISYCTRCDEYQSREIPKTDHEYAATEHEPTCTEQGYTEYVCSCCGDSYRDGYVDSLGHDYEVTSQSDEYIVYTCIRCGDSYEMPSEPEEPEEPEEPDEPDEPVTDCLTYKLSSDYSFYIVTGIAEGVAEENIVIPEEYEGLPVSAIGDGAFENNSFILSVVLGKNITSIGESAFRGCSSLASVNISVNVTYIGTEAFGFCTALEEVLYDAANAGDCYNVFYNAGTAGGGIVLKIGENVSEIPSNFFNVSQLTYSPKLTAIEFDTDCVVTRIGGNAFFGCDDLKEVYLPASVDYVGRDAFYGCSSLAHAEVPAGADIKGGAFDGVADGFELVKY